MSINLRIRKRKSSIGYSRNFAVVENFRRPDDKTKTTHRVIKYFGTLNQHEFGNILTCRKFLQKAEGAVDLLVLQNKISVKDATKVKDKFRSVLWHPLPQARSASKPSANFSKVKNDVLTKFNL